MRGVLSAGSLFALDLVGCRTVFDEVYATSAGGVNAAYFLSGQGELGISVYFDSISNRRFINPFRFWKIVDVDFVYDHVVLHEKTLDEAAIRRGRPAFYLSVTNVDTGQNELLDVKASQDSVALMLKASSALPVLYNEVVRLGSGRYVDGGLTDAMPIAQAAARGCTDILVLGTKSAEHVNFQAPLWERLAFYAMMGRKHPLLGAAHASSHLAAARSRRYALGKETLEGTSIATILPTTQELVVERTTLDRARLIDGARRMAERTFRVFGEADVRLDEAFRRLDPR